MLLWQYEKSLDDRPDLKLVESVEINAQHYLEILSRAVDKIMPREAEEISSVDPHKP